MDRWRMRRLARLTGLVLLFGTIAGFALSILGGEAQAVTLQPFTVEKMTDRAESIVLARVTAVSSRLVIGPVGSASGRTIVTDVQLDILEVLKGKQAEHLRLTLPGGTADGTTLFMDYVPCFTEGETCVLFLRHDGQVYAGIQGKLRMAAGYLPDQRLSLVQFRSLASGLGSVAPREMLASGISGAAGSSASVGEGGPTITGITPSSASAGTNSRVTIRGVNFGEAAGSVDFFYGGSLSQPTIKAPTISWSGTAIVCVVPTGIIEDYKASAGSGPVTVTDASGRTSPGFDFHVTFSNMDRPWRTWTVGYRTNANFANVAHAEAMIDAAARTWNGVSGFRFDDLGACSTTTYSWDGHNDVFWSTELPEGTIGGALTWIAEGQLDKPIEADIGFNASLKWGDGSNGTFDLQAVALHEMGHIIGLRDLYGPGDSDKVMYGFGDVGPGRRALTPDEIAGALYVYGPATGRGVDVYDPQAGGYRDDTTLFTDVDAANPYFAAIAGLVGNGIVSGFSDGTFRPSCTVTRQQFAKMIVKGLGLEVTGSESCPFTDVASCGGPDPFYPAKYVAVCAASRITIGKTETAFGPADAITREQLVTMAARAVGLAPPPASYEPEISAGQFSHEEHFANAVGAEYSGLLDGLVGLDAGFRFQGPCTRAECAQILSNLFEQHPASGSQILLSDDFSGDSVGWPDLQLPDWRWLHDAAAGAYVCTIDSPNTIALSSLPGEWSNCRVEVDVHGEPSTDEVTYGIAFGISDDGSDLYGFTLSTRGTWRLWHRTGGMFGREEVLVEKQSIVVNKGRARNRMGVAVSGDTASLIVNGSELYRLSFARDQVTVGLLAGSPSAPQGQIRAVFDNFKIWSIR